MSSTTPSRSNTYQNPVFVAADHENDGKRHLLLAASGSVATIKLPNIIHALSKYPNLSVRLVLTNSAANFLAGQSLEQPQLQTLRESSIVDGIYEDEDEWVHPWKRGQGILHIELRRWAHVMAVVPLSANTLAKMVNGLSDNLLTSIVRAWDTTGEIEIRGEAQAQTRKIIIAAPAMNTAMWRHPITARQISVLEDEWGINSTRNNGVGWVEVIRPQEKELACGDVGDGAMREWSEVVKVLEQRLGLASF